MKIILLILMAFSSILVYSQHPQKRFVSGADFLGQDVPPVVYDIELDTAGFVYFIYPGDLVKFNGLTTEGGWKLENPDEPIVYYTMHKGFDERILLGGPFGVAYVKGDSILKYPIPDSLVKFGEKGYESIYFDRDNILHISPRYKGYYTVDKLGNVEEMVDTSLGIHGFVTTTLNDGQLFMYSVKEPNNTQETLNLYYLDSDSNLNLITEVNHAVHEASLAQYQDGSLLFSNGESDLVHFNENELINAHRFDFKVHKLFIDSKDFLWVGTIGEGMLKFETPQFEKFEKYGKGTSAVLAESFDHGLWFKSQDDKFGYIPSFEVLNYSPQTGYPMLLNIYEIGMAGEEILILTEDSKLYLLKDEEVSALDLPSVSHISGIPRNKLGIFSFCQDQKTNRIWVGRHGELQGWNGTDWKILKLDKNEFNHFSVYNLKAFSNGRIIGATRRDIFEIIGDEIVHLAYSKSSEISNFTMDDSGKFWITSMDGLWIIEDGKLRRPFEKMPQELSSSGFVIESNQHAIWYQPTNEGLYYIKNDAIRPVFDQFGKRIRLFTLYISPDSTIWGTLYAERKLCRIEVKNDSFNFQYYQLDDFSAKNIGSYRGLSVTDKHVYTAGRHGLFKQEISELRSEETPSKVVITEIRINHEIVAIKDTFNLDYDENFINMTFNGISFRRLPLEYSYQILGIDTIWRETRYKHLQYTNLSPGEYQFNLRVKTIGSDWTTPKSITFIIAKPYWETTWFRISAILLILLVIATIIQLRVSYIRKKEIEKSKVQLEIVRHELRTLKAQMNPHFIFNVLKSIQSRILNGGKWEANDLLVRFSKLIRASLEQARVEFISLEKETEFLANYLEIEKQRVPDKFNYAIEVQDNEDLDDALIPSLLIQPICENAIKHAFEKQNGKLTITIKVLTQDIIEVQVIDDGIGYLNTKNEHHSEQESRGLEILNSRIELFKSQGYDTAIQFEPMDKETNRGTKITVRLPYK